MSDQAVQDQETKPNTSNPTEDLGAISKRIDQVLDVDRTARIHFERDWFRNVLFDIGQHWIVEDRGKWRPRNMPSWFPRAQTNKFAEKKSDLISTLVQGRMPIRYVPETDDPNDVATAEIGERFRDVIYGEARIEENDVEQDLANWMILTGNAFLQPYYSLDKKYGMVNVPMQKCTTCGYTFKPSTLQETGGACPQCTEQGNPNSTSFVPVGDPSDGEEYPIGALCADVLSPFEIRCDYRIRNFENQRRYVRVRRYDVEEAQQMWPDAKQYITPESSTGAYDNFSYLDALATATSGALSPSGLYATGDTKHSKVTAYEIYELPSEAFPDGLRAVRIGKLTEAVVDRGPLPFEYGAGVHKGQKFLNLIHFGFERVAGRFWRKSRLDDVVPLQIFRNIVEANLRLTSQRMANPIWLEPKGSGVDVLSGEPGLRVQYNPVSMGGTAIVKPERIEPALGNVQPLTILLNKIDDAIERQAGTFFLQGGETPPGVTAASALAYLGERAQKAMSPLMRSWAKGWKTFEEQGLEIARENWDDDRIRTIVGRNKAWETETFKKSDLQGSVKMNIDYASLFPKSQATERATIAQLVQLQIVNPADPEMQWEVLQKFGETALKGSIDLDMKEAIKESEYFMQWALSGGPDELRAAQAAMMPQQQMAAQQAQAMGQPPPPPQPPPLPSPYQPKTPGSKVEGGLPKLVPMVQNSIVHIKQHTDFAKGEDFKALPDDVQLIWINHIQAHFAEAQAKAAAQAQMSAASQPGAGAPQGPQPGPNGGSPDGAEGPDHRLLPGGKAGPGPSGQPLPDIAAMQHIQPPRHIGNADNTVQ